MYTQKERGGLYELTNAAHAVLADSKYYNDDLAPTPLSNRNWSTYHISSLWVCMSVCLPAFALTSSLIALGLSPWLAVLNVILGSVIALVPILLNAHVGAKYGIPFPVFSRMTFGVVGAHVPALLRALAGCGWNAILSWTGGTATLSLISAFAPSFKTYPHARIICFIVFLSVVCWIASGSEGAVKILMTISAPVLILSVLGVFVWSIVLIRTGDADGVTYNFSDVMRVTSNIDLLKSNGGFWLVFLGGVTVNIAFWSIMALNIPDFTRFAVSQRAQIRGQLYGMPLAMGACAFIGVFFARATSLVGIMNENGNPSFDPTEILFRTENPFVLFIVSFCVIIAILTTNVAANVVAPANAFSNISPRRISYTAGAVISCITAVICQPWNTSSDAGSSFLTWLDVFGSVLAPMAAIFIADYFLVKRRNVDLMALYLGHKGRYWYQNGWNFSAIFAWVCGWALPALGSSFIPGSEAFYWIKANSYLVNFLLGLLIYTLLMKFETSSQLGEEQSKKLTVHDHLSEQPPATKT